ncbi:MAG: GTPase HflX [Terriglobia bacterium]
MDSKRTRKERAILCGCPLKASRLAASKGRDRFTPEESLEELRSLVISAGGEVVEQVLQECIQYHPATLIGRGKLEELAEMRKQKKADLVVFDESLFPAQQRNVEQRIGCRVIDRTQLILDIFARRARTREGKLQVELAQLNDLLPRLTGKGVELSRLGGGIGTRGPGETKLETDIRKIRRRIHTIKLALEHVRTQRALHRGLRSSVPVAMISLVGYTNAGKSTLFTLLTRAETLASQQVFATLDPLLRRLPLPSKRQAVLSDTVGFINKLPTSLVSAFRATLEEIGQASLLLHVIDVSVPHWPQQRQSVLEVLDSLGYASRPILEVYNKIDLVSSTLVPDSRYPAVPISAIQGTGISHLLKTIDELLDQDSLIRATFMFDHRHSHYVSQLHAQSRLIKETYTEDGVRVEVEAPSSLVQKFKPFQI